MAGEAKQEEGRAKRSGDPAPRDDPAPGDDPAPRDDPAHRTRDGRTVRAERTRDGRTVRAERTRRALVEALLALLDEGQLRPTAAGIAARAGVSERSVFQHFPDREALLEAVAREQYERVMPTLRPVDASRPLAERIDALAGQRCRMFEEGKGVRRAALLMESESDVVAGWLTSVRRAGAAEVERVFRRELENTAADEREPLRAALVATCSWGCYESLRLHQGLSVARTRGAMRTALSRLLGEG